jgi:hypothetical protein
MKKQLKTDFSPFIILLIQKYFVPLHPNFGPLMLKESLIEDIIQQLLVFTVNHAAFEGLQVDACGLFGRVAHALADM